MVRWADKFIDCFKDQERREVLLKTDPQSVQVKSITNNSKDKGSEAVSKRLRHALKGRRKMGIWIDKFFKFFIAQELWEVLPETDPQSVQVKSIFDDILKVLRDKKIKHIDNLDWEILVVKNSKISPEASWNGKIVFSQNFLEEFPTDLEIATIIGHEVAHVVTWPHVCKGIKQSIRADLNRVCCMDQDQDLRFYYLREDEYYADYIGMILMAYAGYDPRAAPIYYAKMGKLDNRYDTDDFLQTHPCGKNREERLSRCMEEAMDIYTHTHLILPKSLILVHNS